jgi:hypothetical protein
VVLAAAAVASTALATARGEDRAESAPTPLEAGFREPPASARPRVWWHWLNGNITRDGVQKDLDWMARVGLGGLQNFDAALSTPLIAPHRISYMSPEWKDTFRFAVTTADRLGLEFGIAGSPGWSESGGPWVPAQDGMKKLVWSETILEGGQRFAGALAPLPSATGPYQSLPKGPDVAELLGGGKPPPPPTARGEAAVVAYRLPDVAPAPPARISTGDGQILDPGLLGDPAGPGVTVPRGSAQAPGTVVADYGRPATIRSAAVYLPGSTIPFVGPTLTAWLEAQGGDGAWRKIADVPAQPVPTTVSFAPTTARRFRLVLGPAPATPRAEGVAAPGAVTIPFGIPGGRTAQLALFQLSAEPRVNRFETKAGFMVAEDYYALDANADPEVAGVAPESVIDLTGRMSADGRLDWTPPPGRWKVLRLGWSLLGTTNHPATREATGLEVDEYDGAAVRRYLQTYLGAYQAVTGPELMGKRGLRAQINDSTEIGPSNWTPAILERFQQLRGYDARPWLPALTGVVVGSRARSDAFLYDFRRTLAELLAREHYATVAEMVRSHGMIEYGEALESQRVVLGDDMAMRRHADIPMAALWAYNPAYGPQKVYLADMRGAASVAHVYGQNLAAAESMTSASAPWAFAPSDLKRYIDLEFVSGINLPVIHTSVHQPVDDKIPGLSLLFFGQYFNRHETWAEMARPWVDYMARSAYLLQQGRNVADVAYFYGEEAPLIALYKDGLPADAPVRYAYDFVNRDVVLTQLSVDGHELTTPAGARYKALYLGGSSRRMTLPVLRRLAELADAGAIIVGVAPESSPALDDDPVEFASLVKRLWGGGAETAVGRGRVAASGDVEAALRTNGTGPDFSYSGAGPDAEVLFAHRRLADGDLYYVDNRKARAERLEARFRVTGKAPEIWRADTGGATPASYRQEGDEAVVPLELAPEDALFVVFRHPAAAAARTVAETRWVAAGQIAGGWDLAFQAERGAPATAHIAKLASLTENPDPGIKYFSGTVTYRTTFSAPRGRKAGAPLMLDLGKVGDIAEVSVNGQQLGYAWKAPYRVDIGKAVRRGRNTLEVKVADLWVNRLIGDSQPGAKKITFTNMPTYLPTAPLRPSGLIGPVALLAPALGSTLKVPRSRQR